MVSAFSKGILENFANFTGKQLCQSLFFNKAALLKRDSGFSCEICEIFKNNVFTEHLRTTASQHYTVTVEIKSKIRTSFKTLASKTALAWWLKRTINSNFIEIKLRHEYSPVICRLFSEHLFENHLWRAVPELSHGIKKSQKVWVVSFKREQKTCSILWVWVYMSVWVFSTFLEKRWPNTSKFICICRYFVWWAKVQKSLIMKNS